MWKKGEQETQFIMGDFPNSLSIVWLCQQLSADFEAIYSWKKQDFTFLPLGFE